MSLPLLDQSDGRAEAATYNPGESSIVQGRWTSTLSNKLLVEAGASHYLSSLPRKPQPDATEPSILEQSNNLIPVGRDLLPHAADRRRLSRLHRLRDRRAQPQGWLHVSVGVRQGSRRVHDRRRQLPHLNGIPNQVTDYTTPHAAPLYLKPFGLFVQDQLKIRRWTINAGPRYDQFRTSYDAIHLDPVRWLPVSRDYPGAEVLNWKISHRGLVSPTTCSATDARR